MPFAEATQFRSCQIVFRHLFWCCLNYTTTGQDSVKQGYTKRGQSVHDFNGFIEVQGWVSVGYKLGGFAVEIVSGSCRGFRTF